MRARSAAGEMLLALDFDGTLAPIADRPEVVRLPPAAAEALGRLRGRPDTRVAIVSGRALADVEARVGLPGIVYVGNHGMEIRGPGVARVLAEAAAARPRLERAARALRERLAAFPGVIVEDKGFTVAVHYRLARDPAAVEAARDAIGEAARTGAFRVTGGKMVLELRPDVDWHKGAAVRFLADTLLPGRRGAAPVVYVGDDATDEDAFRELRGWGEGVVVAPEPPPETAATAFVRSPEEVAALLAALARPDRSEA